MTLTDFFLAVNAVGIRLANVGGQLQLRGPSNAISDEIKAGAAEHKAAILALLPPSPSETVEIEIPEMSPCDPAERARAEAELEEEIRGREVRTRDYNLRDWRLEWLTEVGVLYLRMRACREQDILALLRPLADATPGSLAEWLALGQQIANIEHELRQQGRLPPHPWPERGEP